MPPGTRELVLKARMPEIMAFAEDRRLDPSVVAGVVEASMRLGRIPDLGLYGLAGDEANAVKDFVATAMLGLEAEFAIGVPNLTEGHAGKHHKHAAHAQHYRKLADHHAKTIEFHTQSASKANKEGRPFTAAKHQAKIALLKQLHASHAALADYHDCEAQRFGKGLTPAVPEGAGPTNVDQPTGQPTRPTHPAPGSTAAQRPEVPVIPKQEQVTSAMTGPFVKPVAAVIKRSPIKLLSKWKDVPEKEDESLGGCHEQRRDFFNHAPMLEDLLAEAVKAKDKRDKKATKKPVVDKKAVGIKADPDKIDKTIANVKIAPLFQQLGHKMDHAYAKLIKRPVKKEWTEKLFKAALSKGGGAASDEVVKASLTDPWIRDQGFVEEGGNLRAQWATMMSAETQENAIKASPTTPEPVVFTINRMIDMAQGKGSIF